MRNVDKNALAEVTITSSAIDLDGKNSWLISKVVINAAKDLGLTDIKKYLRLTDQIKKKINRLYIDWISAFDMFVKHFWKTYNNKKVTENMKIWQNIDLG